MWRDEAYILDILLAARKIVKFSQDYDAEKFAADEVWQHAVMGLIQIIGEAARKISPAYQEAHPEDHNAFPPIVRFKSDYASGVLMTLKRHFF